MQSRYFGAIVALVVVTGSAWAETAQMRGKFPAAVRAANLLENIVVDRFDGRQGGQFEVVLEQQIGRPAGQPDAFLTGTVNTGIRTEGYKGSENRCVEWKDGKQDGDCLKRAKVEVPCTRRMSDVTVSIRLIRVADRVPIWSDNRAQHDEMSWCDGKQPYRSYDATISSMMRDIALKLKSDLRPYVDTYKVRFREDREGMPKDVGERFKGIVKLSQKDVALACQQWALLNDTLPNNASIVYNLGVCAEANGAYPDARDYYRAAQAAVPNKAGDMTESINRVARLMQARADDEEIARRKPPSR